MLSTKSAYALIAIASLAMAGVQATDASTIGVEVSAVALAQDGDAGPATPAVSPAERDTAAVD
jgi:hypothetical protein